MKLNFLAFTGKNVRFRGDNVLNDPFDLNLLNPARFCLGAALLICLGIAPAAQAEESEKPDSPPAEAPETSPTTDAGEESAQAGSKETPADATDGDAENESEETAAAPQATSPESAAIDEKPQPGPESPKEENAESSAEQSDEEGMASSTEDTSESLAATSEDKSPSPAESRTVAWVFSGISLAALGTGIMMGMDAQTQYDCLADVVVCNEGQAEPIEGTAFIDAKSDLDRSALLADMAYLSAAVTASVAIAGWIRSFASPQEEDGGEGE